MSADDRQLESWVSEAQGGDKLALEHLLTALQDNVYHLAMRMLVNPDDAQEASQEILILVVTKLSTFRAESTVRTWVYRVASNYLLNSTKSLARDRRLSFEQFRADLEGGLQPAAQASAEDLLMLNQLRISCTMAMLLCLDRPHRLAYVLGDILECDQAEAVEILQISKANYRQRLSRARREVQVFSGAHCGLVNQDAACSCPRRLPAARNMGRVSADAAATMPADAPDYSAVKAQAEQLEQRLRAFKLQRATGRFLCPEGLAKEITALVSAGP